MSSILAISIGLGLLGIVAAPALAAMFRPAADRFVLSFYAVLLAVLGIYHIGFPGAGSELVAASRAAQDIVGAEGTGALCERALSEAERGGLILDRSNATRVSVNGPMWRRVPAQAQRAVATCLEAALPEDATGTPVEIIEVGL